MQGNPLESVNQTALTWQNKQSADPSGAAQQQHQSAFSCEISPNLSDDITDPGSYLLAYDMESINDLTVRNMSLTV